MSCQRFSFHGIKRHVHVAPSIIHQPQRLPKWLQEDLLVSILLGVIQGVIHAVMHWYGRYLLLFVNDTMATSSGALTDRPTPKVHR
jgi:hypothetical protein